MKLGCKRCGTYERHEPCPDCGNAQHIGDDYRCPHGPALRSKGFVPYYDIGLDRHVTTIGDINAACRPHWENDHVVHLQPSDKPDSYYRELNERREARANARP